MVLDLWRHGGVACSLLPCLGSSGSGACRWLCSCSARRSERAPRHVDDDSPTWGFRERGGSASEEPSAARSRAERAKSGSGRRGGDGDREDASRTGWARDEDAEAAVVAGELAGGIASGGGCGRARDQRASGAAVRGIRGGGAAVRGIRSVGC